MFPYQGRWAEGLAIPWPFMAEAHLSQRAVCAEKLKKGGPEAAF